MVKCYLHEIFNISPGITGILEFEKGAYPKIGRILKHSTSGDKWEIFGVSMGSAIEDTNFTFALKFGNNLFPCVLKPFNHNNKLEIGEMHYVD